MLNLDKESLRLIQQLLGLEREGESDFRAQAILRFNDLEALKSHLLSSSVYSISIETRAKIIRGKTADILPDKPGYLAWMKLLSASFDLPISYSENNFDAVGGLIVGIFQSLEDAHRFFQGELRDEFRQLEFSIVAKMALAKHDIVWSHCEELQKIETAAKEWVRQTNYGLALKQYSPLFEEICRKLPGNPSGITKSILNGLIYGLFGALDMYHMMKLLSFIPLLENRSLSVSQMLKLLDQSKQ